MCVFLTKNSYLSKESGAPKGQIRAFLEPVFSKKIDFLLVGTSLAATLAARAAVSGCDKERSHLPGSP